MITVNLRPGQKRKRAGAPFNGDCWTGSAFPRSGRQGEGPLLMGRWRLGPRARRAGSASTSTPRGSSTPWSRGWSRPGARTGGSRPSWPTSGARRRSAILCWLRSRSSARWTATATSGLTCSTRSPKRSRPTPGWSTSALPPLRRCHRAGQARTKADSAAAAAIKPPLTFQITGRTIDIQAYTRFLRQLEASPWIRT